MEGTYKDFVNELVEEKKIKKTDKQLALTMAKFLHKEGQLPVTRTECYRTAFEDVTRPNYRATVDESLWMFQEQWVDQGWTWKQGAYSASRPNYMVPYGVLELKLRGGELDDVLRETGLNEMIAERSLIPLDRFSKYATAIAKFYPDSIDTVPSWMDHLNNADLGENVPGAIITKKGREKVAKPEKIPKANKVDPKLILANERTLLNWLQNSVFLGMFGVVLSPSWLAVVCLILSCLATIQGTYLYIKRLYCIRNFMQLPNGVYIIPVAMGVSLAILFPLVVSNDEFVGRFNSTASLI